MPATAFMTAVRCALASTALLLSPASGLADDVIQGRYCGKLFSSGKLVGVVTRLTTRRDTGLLSGSYEFADDGQTTRGTLRQYQYQKGDDTQALDWIDKYGTGQLVIRFDESRNAFTGAWGFGDGIPLHQWDGERCDGDVAAAP